MRQFLQKVCRKKWKMPRNHRRLIGALPFLCAVILPRFALADTMPAWPDTFLARVEALAVVETLNAALLAARSATFTLDKWCADHKLSGETKIRARLVKSPNRSRKNSGTASRSTTASRSNIVTSSLGAAIAFCRKPTIGMCHRG